MKTKYVRYISENGWRIMIAAMDTAIQRAKTRTRLAQVLGIHNSLITHWYAKKRLPTLEQALAMDLKYQVARKSLRPDVDWDYVDLGNLTFTEEMRTALGEDLIRLVGVPKQIPEKAHSEEPKKSLLSTTDALPESTINTEKESTEETNTRRR